MDFLGKLYEHFVDSPGLALVFVLACIGLWFLYQHTRDCSQSRRNLYDAINGLRADVHESRVDLGERLSKVEAATELKLMQDVAATKSDIDYDRLAVTIRNAMNKDAE